MLDNQMLLLVVLGLAIFYLTRPSKPTEENNAVDVEQFAESNLEFEVDASEIVDESGSSGEFMGTENVNAYSNLTEVDSSLHGGADTESIPVRPVGDFGSALPDASSKQDGWFEDAGEMELDDAALISVKAGHHIGVNTVGQTLRNATYDLRGTIPNPKSVVSPWMNSTIEPDTNIKSWCN